MNILVTGGNGFVGTALIKQLFKEGHNITSIDDLSIGTVDNEVDGVKYIHDDVNNIFNYEIFYKKKTKSHPKNHPILTQDF